MRRPTGRSGFTLLEVLVVLAILVVSAALVLPSLGRGTGTLRLRAEARAVVALLRQARQLAVSQRRPHTVALDPSARALLLTRGEGEATVARLALSEGLHLRAKAGETALTFTPRGMARETVWLLEGPAGRRYRVQVEAVTGRATMRREA